MSDSYSGTWSGGYIFIDKKGRRSFIIRKRIDGKLYKVATRCRTEDTALRELERFERDPINYRPGLLVEQERLKEEVPIFLTPILFKDIDTSDSLSAEFIRWKLRVKKNSVGWCKEQCGYLSLWSEHLRKKDLKTVTIDDLDRFVPEGCACRPPKIAVIKSFYGWLVKTKRLLKPSQDPTFRVLMMPQATPAQNRGTKVIPQDSFHAVRPFLPARFRDAIDVLIGTGLHLSELKRFCQGGDIEPAPPNSSSDVAGVLVCPKHKSGSIHRTAVSVEVLEAAKRLRAIGNISTKNLRTALREASKKAQVGKVLPGSFRHTVASNAVNAGADMEAVSTFLGHKSKVTTMRYYAQFVVPAKIKTVI